jgi:hypothetical protein
MKKIALPIATSLLVLSFLAATPRPALAHETSEYGDVSITAGWQIEPPLVGQMNAVVLEITRVSNDQPITNALAQMDISVKKGAPTKSLDFQPQEEPGVYAAQILPTQTGQYIVVMKGTIAGQAVDGQVQIEDVEDTTRFEFPPGSGGISDETLKQLQAVITDLTEQVDEANIAANEAKEAAQSSAELKTAVDSAYLFGMIGIGVGVAGIAIAVAAMRREKV